LPAAPVPQSPPQIESFAADLAKLKRTQRAVQPGEIIAVPGAPMDAFHFVLEGEVEAFDPATDARYGEAVLGPPQFTGNLGFLTGANAILGSRAAQAGRNRLPCREIALDSSEARCLAEACTAAPGVPMAMLGARQLVAPATPRRLAEQLGIDRAMPDGETLDVLIAGAGPAGVAAAARQHCINVASGSFTSCWTMAAPPASARC